MAVPTARVARRLTPLTFSTGLQLARGVAPKPPFCPSTYIYTEIYISKKHLVHKVGRFI